MSAGSDQSQSLKELSKQNGRPSPTVPAKRVKTANKNIPHAAAAVATPAPASSSALILPKVEPGTSSASSRLASFRSPRDLSMSGLNFPASVAASNLLLGPSKQKRVYVPNIPTKREKCETKANTGRSDRGRGGRGGGSDRGGRGSRGGRGRGRGRGNNLVQMKGLWAEGVASVAVRNSSGGPSHFGGGGGGGLRRNPVGGGGGGGGGGGSIKAEDGVMQRPVVTGENMTVDKDEEDQCLSSLLDDDDDVDDADDDDSAKFYERFCKPMCLALEQVKTEPQTSSTPAVSTDSPHQSEMPQIKVEPGEAPCLTNGHSSEMSNGTQPPVAVEESSKPNVRQQASVGDIFSQNKRTMFLWQLPKTLPSIISRDAPASTDKTSASTGSSSGGGEEEESASKKASEYCRLSDLPPGQIGFVKVYKSGRAELCLGDYALPITVGCKKAHLEEVAHVSIDEGSKTGKMAVLGRVEQRLLVRPPFEKLVDITRCRR